jgi:hypothetical protein
MWYNYYQVLLLPTKIDKIGQLLYNKRVAKRENKEGIKVKAFIIEFEGYYPVGACAVVVAETKRKAVNALKIKLEGMHLSTEIEEDDIREIDMSKPNVDIVLDGNY